MSKGSALELTAAGPSVVGLGLCLLCGSADPLSLGVCPRCRQRESDRPDARIFVEGGLGSRGREAVAAKIGALTGLDGDARAVVDCASGKKCLLAAPSSGAEVLSRQLGAKGVPVRVVPASRAWRQLPMSFQGLMLATAVIGGVLGMLLDTLYPIVTLGMLLGLTWGATRALAQPLLRPKAATLELPQGIQSRAVSTLAQLAPGPAR